MKKTDKKYYITGKNVLIGGKLCENVGVLTADGKVAGYSTVCPEGFERVETDGGVVLPGFIDIHLHGGGGYDFMDATPEAFEGVLKTHCLCGTTSLCPTTCACPPEMLYDLFDLYESAKANTEYCDLLGVHMEGPFISMEMKGAQNPNYIYPPEPRLLDEILERGKGIISRISYAPEIPYAAGLAERLGKEGIVRAIAHSATNCTGALEAYRLGARLITHLYCSTSTVHKENQKVHGGIVQAYYLEDDYKAEIIGDGCHVPPEVIRMVNKLKGAENFMFITDAMRAAGTDLTESYLGAKLPENRVIIEEGVAKLPDRSFYAGSIATMDRVFRNAVLNVGLDIPTVSRLMSETPAKTMGVQDRKGSLGIGMDADIVVMDENYNVAHVFVGGRKI